MFKVFLLDGLSNDGNAVDHGANDLVYYKKNLRHLYLTCRGTMLAPFCHDGPALSSSSADYCASILVITMDRLGDLVWSLPAINALRRFAPAATITICSPPYIKDLLDQHPDIDRWLSIDECTADPKKHKFDLVIDLSTDYPLKKAFLALRTGAPVRIGYNIHGRGLFFTHSLPCNREKIHTGTLLTNLLSLVGINASENPIPRLYVKPKWQDELAGMLPSHVGKTTKFVAIHPGGTYPTQRWPAERFAAIACRLYETYTLVPLLLGGPAEVELCREMEEAMKCPSINLCHKLSLGGLSAAIKQAEILLCNNSGPLHLAVALDTPSVSTMGPTLPEAWWPLGRLHQVVHHELPCSPCNEGICREGSHECLLSISSDEMWQAVQAHYEQCAGEIADKTEGKG